MDQALKASYVFGEFRLDCLERRLLRQDAVILLAPKVFDTLLLLVENAGHLVEKDDFMKRLWPDTFVGEDALTRNISILRKALGESQDSQSFIETVPTRGYRFLAPVQQVRGSGPGMVQEKSAISAAGKSTNLQRVALLVPALAVGSAAGLVTFYLLSPPPVPRVVRSVQLTHSGRVDPWTTLVSDGVRVYFNEREGDHWNLVETSVGGGESQIVAAPFRNTMVRDISPDHANLLIETFEEHDTPMRLWTWPVQGGAPTRIGEITALDAAWCPNGREIIYAEDDGIYLANTNGTNTRKFLSTEGRPGAFTWSPDGHSLRFTTWTWSTGIEGAAMWEVRSDGTSLRRLIPGWITRSDECCGSWTPDGRYFLFDSKHSGSRDIWAIEEKGSWLRRRQTAVIRMTAGPTDFAAPLLSSSGHRALVYGINCKNELVSYDLKSRQFRSLFPGTPAGPLAFSRDGEWVAYVSERDHSLVRMRRNATERLTIVPPPLEVGPPRWSPDSKGIAFYSLRPNRTYGIFLVSPDSGSLTELILSGINQFDPMWSPDGKFLAFTREEPASPSGKLSDSIHLYDLSTRQDSLLSGSQGLRAPSWSPNGRFLAAKSEDQHRLMLFDFQTRKWAQLAEANLIFELPWWSKDGECLYYQDTLAPNQPIYRLHLSNQKKEVVVTFEQFLGGSANRGNFFGLAPDGSLIASLVRNEADVYALDLELP